MSSGPLLQPLKLYFRSHQLQKQFNTPRPALTTLPIAKAAHLKKGTGIFVNLFFIGQVLFILLQLYFILGNKAGITSVHTRSCCFCPFLKKQNHNEKWAVYKQQIQLQCWRGKKLSSPQKFCTSLTHSPEESVTGKGLWKKNKIRTPSFPASNSALQGVELLIFVPQNFHSLDWNKVYILLKFFCSRTSEHLYPHNHLLFSSLSEVHTWQKQLMVHVSISLGLSLNVTLTFLFYSPKIYIKYI